MGKGTYISKQNNNHVLLKKMTLTDMHKRLCLCKSATNPLPSKATNFHTYLWFG